MGCIYMLVNKINKKIYIGKTTYSLEKRLNEHKSAINRCDKYDTKLYRALRKYGIENFEVINIKDNIDNEDELNKLETEYINKYDSYNNGYNSTLGGDGVSIYTDKDKEFIIETFKKCNNIAETSRITGVHPHTIRIILKSSNNYVDKHSEKIGIVMYSIDFEPEHYFISIFSIKEYLGMDAGNLYNRLKLHFDGSLFVGHRWQLASDLVFENKIFRTKFDKEAYIQGKHAYQPEGKKYYIVDGALDNILNKKKTYKPYKTCKICGIEICNQSKSNLCLSCSQVVAKGKTPKPSKEELQALLDRGLQIKQIAEIYKRNPSTVSTWKKQYNIL